ncbi:hypothetical protein VTI74DRAFT_5548 [Chaetomium olivicolor]
MFNTPIFTIQRTIADTALGLKIQPVPLTPCVTRKQPDVEAEVSKHDTSDDRDEDPSGGNPGQYGNTSTRQGYRLYAVAIGVCFGALMMSLDISIIGTALPSITSSPGFSSSTNIACSFTFIFLVGSILCGWAPNSSAFIAGRAIAGVGAAGVASNGLTILVTIAPGARKAIFMGMGAVCFAVGLVGGPLLGGAFTERLSWRWCFWINIPFNIVTLAVVSLFFRPQQGRDTKSLSSRIKRGERGVWSSPTVIGLFVGSGLTILLFAIWESRRGPLALIPPTLLRRTLLCTLLFASTHMSSLTIASYYLPVWFQSIQATSPLQSGIRMLPTVLTQIVMTILASSLALHIRYYNPWFFLAPVFMCTSSVLYTTFTPATPAREWIGYQIVQGVGAGLGMQMASLAVQLEMRRSGEEELVPVGIAMVMFVQYLGATVVQVVAGTVLNTGLMGRLGPGGVGLTEGQVGLLLNAGIRDVRGVVQREFPGLVEVIVQAYNEAITRVFFVPVGGAVAGFLLAFGIKWNPIEGAVGGGLAQPRSARTAKAEAKKDGQKGEAKT